MSEDFDESVSEKPNYNPCYSAFRQTQCYTRFVAMARQLRNLLLRFEDEEPEFKLQALDELITQAQKFKKEIEEKQNDKKL